MGNLLDLVRKTPPQEKTRPSPPVRTETETPEPKVNSFSSFLSSGDTAKYAVYLDDRGDLRFLDPEQEREWWLSDDENRLTWHDFLQAAGVPADQLDDWSGDPIRWNEAWISAGRPRNLAPLRQGVQRAWSKAELTATPELLSEVIGREVNSVREAFDTATFEELARLYRYARKGVIR